jgi:hypothetical protein
MNEEILKRIDVLAAKLNTTGEHLWGVLLIQQRKDAITKILLFVAGLYLIWLSVRAFRKLPGAGFHDEPKYIIGGIVSGVVGVFFAAFGFDWWGHLINPEYYALKEILEMLK